MSPPSPPPERRLYGVVLRCGSATAFAIMGAMLKIASNNGATVVELIFYRSLGAFLIVAPWVLPRGGWAAIRMRRPVAHLTRSVVGLTSMALTFGALALLPLAQATTLSYSAPIGATILSALVLREQVGIRRWLAVLVGFGGVVLVAHPFGAHIPVAGLSVGIAASLAQAGVMITVRQIARSESTSSIVFWFTVMTGIASATLLPWFGALHTPALTALLVAAGMFGGVGQLTMTGSLRYAPVSVVVPFDYLQIIWATAIGWLFFADAPPATMLAGALLIAGSGIYTAYRERKRGQRVAEAMAAPEA